LIPRAPFNEAIKAVSQFGSCTIEQPQLKHPSDMQASLKRELEEIAKEMEEQEEKYKDTKERLDEALKRQVVEQLHPAHRHSTIE
jgi:hypothetical protein